MKNDRGYRAQRAEERAFDLLHNEGGSGYNPCREERLERERLGYCITSIVKKINEKK